MAHRMAKIDTHSSIEGYFKSLLETAIEDLEVEITPEGFEYVLRLFSDFNRIEKLQALANQEPGTPALVWLYERAQTVDEGQRFAAYRNLGDVALLVSGLFAPHIERQRSLVGVDYYIDMGSSAYGCAASLARTNGFGHMLRQLAGKFSSMVEVLTRVAEETTLPVNHSIERIYERYMKHPKSKFLQDKLIETGSMPVFGLSKAVA